MSWRESTHPLTTILVSIQVAPSMKKVMEYSSCRSRYSWLVHSALCSPIAWRERNQGRLMFNISRPEDAFLTTSLALLPSRILEVLKSAVTALSISSPDFPSLLCSKS